MLVCEKRYFRIGIEARPGMPVKALVCWSSMMPPSRFTSPSFRRISCSILRWPMTGWLMPPMLTYEVTAETSSDSFNETSPSGMHARRDVDVHADIEVLKLGIDERVDADSANTGLKRSGRDRHAFADLQ